MNLYPLMDLMEYFSKFQLELLSKEWIDFTWRNEFPTPLELPSDYELQIDVSFVDLLRDVREFIKRWLEEEMEVDSPGPSRDSLTPRKSWNHLVHQVNHKALLCLLSSFISQYNQTSDSDDGVDVKARAIEAARLYFTLISIDGSHIFQIYQGAIYFQCLELLKSLASVSPRSKVVTKGRGRRKNVDNDYDHGLENGHAFVPLESREFIKQFCCLVDDLHECLQRFSLRIDQSALTQTVQVMIQVASVERRDALFLNHRPKPNTTTYLAYKAYSIIEVLCTGFHGTLSETLKDVMRHLLPCLCIYAQQSWQQVSQDIVVIKDHSIHFIIKLVKSLKENSYSAVYTVVQQLCVRVPDKADTRTKYVDIITDLIFRFPYNLYCQSLLFMCSLCCSDVIRHRLIGVELLAKVLSIPPKDQLDDTLSTQATTSNRRSSSNESSRSSAAATNGESNSAVAHSFMFSLIISRCKDISPRIRIKSLSILSHLLRSREMAIREITEEIFIFNVDNEVKEFFDFNKFFRTKSNERELVNVLPTAGSMIHLIERLTQDAKALVRKNALHVISDICMLHERWITEERLHILISACKDLSVGNRKLMAQCLTDLLEKNPDSVLLISSWVEGVVPLFAENEVKSQEKVLELAASIILDNIVPIQNMSSSKSKLPWRVIAVISKYDMRKLFRFACQQWCIKNFIKDPFIKHLQTYIGSENNFVAWYFLVCISEFMNLPNPETILNHFYAKIFRNTALNELESQLVMQALVLNWRKLKKDQITELCMNLKESLETYNTPLPLISGSMDIVHLNNPEQTKEWAEQVLKDCQSRIKERVLKIMIEEYYSDTLLCRYIFTLGEVSQICPDKVDKETIKSLSNLIDFSNIDNDIPGLLEKSLSNFGYVHAVTVCTLGRLCLQDQFIAKSAVPILGALVSAKTCSAIKNNANIALTDLCIRFSSLVEPFFGDMFVCLKDPDPVVRKNTLMLLAMLIQEQFLKLKCHVFIYLLSMLRDPSSEIRDFISSFLVNSLMAKDANIAFTHFTQGIFFLNGYGGVMDQISPQEKAMFCLPGEECTAARRELYIFLLQNMNDVLKFKTKFRICVEILNAIAEGSIPLEATGETILKDSLYILGCDEIKITIRKGGKDCGAEDEDDEVSEPVAVAKKSIMNHIVSSLTKKNLMENVIPIIKSLRHKLQAIKSPLVVDVMVCLREILKDFDAEQVEEILAADPDLASEVLYELNRMEEREGPNQSQEDPAMSSPQDTIMSQLEQVARRISCRVILHGPESIAQDDDSNENGQLVENGNVFPELMANDTTPAAPRTSRIKRESIASQSSTGKQNGISPPSKPEMKGSKTVQKSGRNKRSSSQRSDRSNSILSDAIDENNGNCSPLSSVSFSSQVSSLSSQSSSSGSSGSGSRRRKKR